MEAESSSVIKATRRPRKRVKTNPGAPPESDQVKRRTTRKKVGKLAELPNMPLDILFEIFGHLLPYDLLKLARTTKAFRQLLLQRSSLSIWKTALGRIPGLPPCPPDMSEPAFANLVFSPHCHFCLTQTRKVEWCLRIRICSKCSEERLKNLGNLIGSPTISERQSKFSLLIPSDLGKRGKLLYLPSSLNEFTNKYLALPEDDRESFLEEQKHMIGERNKHAQLCESWELGRVKDRGSELRQLRHDRLDAIIQKLEKLGWGEDVRGIQSPDFLAKHKLVDRPQRLTEKIWANIKDDILEFMQEMREKRLQREYKALVIKRKEPAVKFLKAFKKSNLHEAQTMPEGPDFCNFDIVKEILHQPVEIEVNFDAILPLLPPVISQWREGRNESLLQLLKESHQKESIQVQYHYDSETDEYDTVIVVGSSRETSSSNDSKLELATTVFRCDSCSSKFGPDDFYFSPFYDDDDVISQHNVLLFYPQVCGHRCLTRCQFSWMDPFQQVKDYSSDLVDGFFDRRVPWNERPLAVDHDASRVAKDIVVLLGLDPSTATTNDLDQLQHRLICHTCVKYPSNDRPEHLKTDTLTPVPVLTWRAAVNHHMDHHRGSTSFRVLSEWNEELEVEERTHKENWRIWSCLRCMDTPQEVGCMSLIKIKDHCSTNHDIKAPVLNEDYCKDFAVLDIEAKEPALWVNWNNGSVSIAPQA